ncbi:MAG TPA: sugar ABC transporter substrate-binding protein [Anaerolineae bacterium]|nr:sugar ABC transporter substrate-binding protein [Anaerolineae bacterium]
MKRYILLLSVMTALALFAVACGAPAAAPTAAPAQPTSAPAQATSAPAATLAPTEAAPPTATEAAASGEPTAVPTPTFPPPVSTGGEGCAPNSQQVSWFVGLGAGSNPPEVVKEKAFVDKFNKSQTEYCLLLSVVYNNGQNSYDALRARIAAGNPPDIVGPVGKAGRASFQGAWADIQPLAEKAGFDLSKYDPKLLDFTKDEGVLVGIPFALFPSFIYYNKALFDEAKLPYPPHKLGEQYMGKPWDLQALQDLAMKLTVDKNGNDATSADFDPKNIAQFGFVEQYTDGRGVGAFFGGGLPYDPKDPKKAVIPDNWKAAWKWYYDGMWKYHFMPTADYYNSDQFGKGNPFSSGNIAMAWTHTWYTCCFDVQKFNWDIAVVPTINGQVTAKLHGDTFAILKASKNQDAAFAVLSKMITDKDLYNIYGGMPAIVADRPDFFKAFDERVAPNKVDWSVVEEMVNHPDLPNHEAWTPNLTKNNDEFNKWKTFLDQTAGLDLDKEIDALQQRLTAIYASAPAQ